MKVRFGPAGLPGNASLKESLMALHRIGFGACELDFVKEFWVDKAGARDARDLVKELGIIVRAHAPFYGVLSQEDHRKAVMAVAMMHHTANLIHLMGGDGITVHPGFYMGRPRERVMGVVRERCRELEERLERNGIRDVTVGVENMGNRREFGGSLADILEICESSSIFFPMIDWGHIQATCDGCLGGKERFVSILSEVEERLGREGLKKTRHQFSEVEYADGKERRHLGYGEGQMRLEPLLDAMEEMGLEEAVIISECPSMKDHRRMLQVISDWMESRL